MKKIYLLLLFLPIFLTSCEKEEVDPTVIEKGIFESVNLTDGLTVLSQNKSKTKTKNSLTFNVLPETEKSYYLDIKNSTAKMLVIPATNSNPVINSRIFMLKINESIEPVIFNLYPNENSTKNLYSGRIGIFDLKGDFIIGYKVEAGALVSKYLLKKSKTNLKMASPCEKYVEGTDWPCGELNEVIVVAPPRENDTNTIDINYIYSYNDPNRGGDNHEETTIDYLENVDAGGGGAPSPSEEEDKIDDSQLTGKEKCLNELLNKKGDSYVKNLLSNFQGDDSEFDISISSVDQIIRDDISKTGLTQKPINGVINILISSSEASSRPALGAARTLLHEYIHADMFRKLNTKYSTSEDLDFKNTYESFKNGNFKASPQHETMAELYIHEMTSSLQAFHRNVLTGDYMYLTDNGMNPLPISFYEALAWQGLKEAGVAAYNELSPEKKTELQNALEMYYSTTTTSCPNP